MKNKIILLIIIFLFSNIVFGQVSTANQLSSISYDNPKLYEIGGITISGVKYLDMDVLIHLSGLKVGEEIYIPGEEISNAINKLWKQGLFADIKISATKIMGNRIFLDIYLKERPRLSKFTFTGIKKSEADDIREEIKLVRGTQVTDNLLNNTKNLISNFFIEKGFLRTEVTILQEPDTILSNHVILKINIDKKTKIKINEIVFEGNVVYKDKKLQRFMKETKQKTWYNIFKSSKLIVDNYEEDLKKIIEKYNENGYRDAKIIYDSIWDHDEKTVNVKIAIQEGSKYFFRNISWVGNTIYTSEFLNRVLGIKKGDVFNQSTLDENLFIAEDAVSSLYLDNGYLFFSVTPVEVMVNNDSIDIEMRIYEGKQATINKVIISGNTKTNEHVIRREIRSKPGQLFSRSDIIRSTRELAQLGFFDPEKLDVQPSPNPADGTVDLEYIVEERPSDQIELSGGWGYQTVVGTLGLTFSNFSARNMFKKNAWRPIPSGDGQKVSIRAQTNGTYYQAYNFSFVEPWLGGRKPNSLSVSFYHSVIRSYSGYSYYSAYSNPSRGSMKVTGASIGLGRRLTWPDDFFILQNSLNYQLYSLNDYNYFQIQAGNTYVSLDGKSNNLNLSTTFARNSVDAPIYPRRGSLFSLTLECTPPYSIFKENNFWEISDSTEIQNIEDNLDSGESLESALLKQEVSNKYRWIEYHKWKFKSSWYQHLVGDLVLYTNAEFGFLGFYDKNIGHSPFESFRVGGDGISGYRRYGEELIAMRGYEDNSLSSNGGNIYNKYTLELRYPISLNPSATIYGLVFAEGGNAWLKFKDFDPFSVKRSVGFGVRVFLPMIGMLGVDWGFRFDETPGFEANQGKFSFIIGQQF